MDTENTDAMETAIKKLQEKIVNVDAIVWNKYFVKEKEKFGKALQILEKHKPAAIKRLSDDYYVAKNEEHKNLNRQNLVNAIRSIPIDEIRSEPELMNVINELTFFHVEFTNLFLMEVVDGNHFNLQEKILVLEDFLKTTELQALSLNVNLYHIYIVALSYAERSLVLLNDSQRLLKQISDAMELEDLYYWPEKKGSAATFFEKLVELKLIKPKEDNTLSLLEEYNKENRIEWVGENRQLICLLFLLYDGREFKGEKIHEIACKIFYSSNDLNPRSLNNQLIKFIEPKFNKIIDAAIDYPLQKIIDIFKKS